jgi:hypothetical protein
MKGKIILVIVMVVGALSLFSFPSFSNLNCGRDAEKMSDGDYYVIWGVPNGYIVEVCCGGCWRADHHVRYTVTVHEHGYASGDAWVGGEQSRCIRVPIRDACGDIDTVDISVRVTPIR